MTDIFDKNAETSRVRGIRFYTDDIYNYRDWNL